MELLIDDGSRYFSYAVQTKITYIVEYREPPGHDWMRLASDVEGTQYKVTKFTRKKDYYYRWLISFDIKPEKNICT